MSILSHCSNNNQNHRQRETVRETPVFTSLTSLWMITFKLIPQKSLKSSHQFKSCITSGEWTSPSAVRSELMYVWLFQSVVDILKWFSTFWQMKRPGQMLKPRGICHSYVPSLFFRQLDCAHPLSSSFIALFCPQEVQGKLSLPAQTAAVFQGGEEQEGLAKCKALWDPRPDISHLFHTDNFRLEVLCVDCQVHILPEKHSTKHWETTTEQNQQTLITGRQQGKGWTPTGPSRHVSTQSSNPWD